MSHSVILHFVACLFSVSADGVAEMEVLSEDVRARFGV